MIPNNERRKIVAEKLFELANIEAGVIVFSELIVRGAVRWEVVTVGFFLFTSLYTLGYILLAVNKQTFMTPIILFLVGIGVVAISLGLLTLKNTRKKHEGT
jgi:hypothetical protein